jgi:hypothetical protein
MILWTFDIKFPCGIQFTFGSLTFDAGEDENLKMLTLGPATERLTPVYGQAPYFPAISSTTGGACLDLDPYAGLHIHIIKLVQGIPIMASILQPSAGASSSSLSAASPNQESNDDYPKIEKSTCGGTSQNSSSRYPTIGRSEASDARMTNDEMIQNLNLDFNAI